MSQKKYGAVSGKVEKYLQNHIGEKIRVTEILDGCNLTSAQYGAVNLKINRLIKAGKIKRIKTGLYQIKAALLNGHQAKEKPSSEIQVPAITPQAQDMLAQLQAIQTAQPLDLTAILQAQANATQHVILVEQQNRLLNQALDQIIHILEQCGKIEVKS